MRRQKRTVGGLAAAVTVAGLLVVTHDAAATTVESRLAPGAASQTVTLVTGDRVTVFEGTRSRSSRVLDARGPCSRPGAPAAT
jgi:hypothetical protein